MGKPFDESGKDELKLFCIFYNWKKDTYRATQSDSLFVKNIMYKGTLPDAISSIIEVVKKAGVDMKPFKEKYCENKKVAGPEVQRGD